MLLRLVFSDCLCKHWEVILFGKLLCRGIFFWLILRLFRLRVVLKWSPDHLTPNLLTTWPSHAQLIDHLTISLPTYWPPDHLTPNLLTTLPSHAQLIDHLTISHGKWTVNRLYESVHLLTCKIIIFKNRISVKLWTDFVSVVWKEKRFWVLLNKEAEEPFCIYPWIYTLPQKHTDRSCSQICL